MENIANNNGDYTLEEEKSASPHDSLNPSKEKALAELFKVCPEIAQVVKDKCGDTTTLWSLAALARLATRPEMFELEIRIVCDVLRQRVLDGVNGDADHAEAAENTRNKPIFLDKVIIDALPEDCGKVLIKRLNEAGFAYSKKLGWWAWETKERVAFREVIKREGTATQSTMMITNG